jgi:hypothetical protein
MITMICVGIAFLLVLAIGVRVAHPTLQHAMIITAARPA